MLNKGLENTLNNLFSEARLHHQAQVSTEHLLLALLDDRETVEVLQGCGANIDLLRHDLTSFIQATTPLTETNEIDPQSSLPFQRVLHRAIFQIQADTQAQATGITVLIALFTEQDSQAVALLTQQNITRLNVVNFLANGIHHAPELPESPLPYVSQESFTEDTQQLENFTINLNTRAAAGGIDPLIGRAEELTQTIEVLCRRRKNHPLLVGEAGVGKTAIAEGLARLIVSGAAPDSLASAVIYALDLGAMLAGTKYRGDFEKRFKQVLQQLQQQPQAILFIDEIHTIIGAGVASSGVLDAANLLKPLLSNGELRCIGATTYQEYRNIFAKDHALARRFQKIDVPEPTTAQTLEILQGLCPGLEKHHRVKYTHQALKETVELAERYLDGFLPDKAISVLDQAGAHQALQTLLKRKQVIGVNEIEAVVARMARIPAKMLSHSDKNRLRNLTRDLKLMVFGQDKAIEALGAAIKLARAGLGNEQKPIGSFLFAGPTGVGKTEVTRQLARSLGVELLRFDMSEYMERHTASRLIGAPPGYVGYEQGGLLTEAVIKHPYAVLLLDEIEKAHTDVFNLLLQVMDHSTLTDNNGRKADFRHVILVMTTNVGAESITRPSIGFVPQDHTTDGASALKMLFSPEFRNRLDATIQFNYLSETVLKNVVHKLLTELEIQLEHKRVQVMIDENTYQWLVSHGYDKEMGARPMARLIQEKIKKPLAEELLFGQLASGGKVSVTVGNDDLVLTIVPRTLHLSHPHFLTEKI